jgi:hypothetical protein
MSAGAIDKSETIATSPEIHDPAGEPQPRVSSPTLVPSERPGSQDHIISQLIAAGTKANLKDAADRARKPSIGREDTQEQPKAQDAEIAPEDRSLDALTLLQELARKSSDGRTLTPAAEPDKAPPSPPAIASPIAESNPAVRNAEAQLPARGDANRPKAGFATLGYCAILVAGVTGVFLWSRIPAPDSEPRSEPAASPTSQARSDVPSLQPGPRDCDLAASKDPYATYFMTPPNASGSNAGQAADSREGLGWYSLMSLKARLERPGSGC